jgi:hypothetical protein
MNTAPSSTQITPTTADRNPAIAAHPALLPLLRVLTAGAAADVGVVAAFLGTSTDAGVLVGVTGLLMAVFGAIAVPLLAIRLGVALGDSRADKYVCLLWLAQMVVVFWVAATVSGVNVPH